MVSVFKNLTINEIYHRYRMHLIEKLILRKRDTPTSLRTQYQVQNNTHIRINQKVIKKIMMN